MSYYYEMFDPLIDDIKTFSLSVKVVQFVQDMVKETQSNSLYRVCEDQTTLAMYLLDISATNYINDADKQSSWETKQLGKMNITGLESQNKYPLEHSSTILQPRIIRKTFHAIPPMTLTTTIRYLKEKYIPNAYNAKNSMIVKTIDFKLVSGLKDQWDFKNLTFVSPRFITKSEFSFHLGAIQHLIF